MASQIDGGNFYVGVCSVKSVRAASCITPHNVRSVELPLLDVASAILLQGEQEDSVLIMGMCTVACLISRRILERCFLYPVIWHGKDRNEPCVYMEM